MTDAVNIVGLGARTPVGLRAPAAAAAVRARLSRVREHPFMVDPIGEPLRAAFDAEFDPKLLGWERLARLGTAALVEATSALGEGAAKLTVPVLVALPEQRPGFTEADAARIVESLAVSPAAAGPTLQPRMMGRGHAGALLALELAARWLVEGRANLALVGGIESYLHADTLDELATQRRLASAAARSGFVPGEAACFLLVATSSAARDLGCPPLATVRGAATGHEPRGVLGESEVLGEGLSAAVLRAAASLRLPGEAVDAIYCDINGERYKSDEWAMALHRVHTVLRDAAYVAPADSWGDVGAASGALGCLLAVRSWQRGYARGPRALVWAGLDGGLRGAAVLERGST